MTNTSDRDLERVWELHTSSEFRTLDLDTTMATMSQAPEVLHVPTAMGARGRASVRHFYRRWFVGHNGIYGDQAAVLGQTGLLPAETMAWLPVVADQRATLADGPLHQLAGRFGRVR